MFVMAVNSLEARESMTEAQKAAEDRRNNGALGAMAGGAKGAVLGGSVAGPVGALIGAVIGAVAGGKASYESDDSLHGLKKIVLFDVGVIAKK